MNAGTTAVLLVLFTYLWWESGGRDQVRRRTTRDGRA